MGSKSEALQKIQERYEFNLKKEGDQPHLPILKKYGEKCETIVEVGFREGVSASAFLATNPKSFITIDWDRPPFEVNRLILNKMQNQCKNAGIDFMFIREDVLLVDVPDCDLLFLDGFHTYEHVFLELYKHQHVVSEVPMNLKGRGFLLHPQSLSIQRLNSLTSSPQALISALPAVLKSILSCLKLITLGFRATIFKIVCL